MTALSTRLSNLVKWIRSIHWLKRPLSPRVHSHSCLLPVSNAAPISPYLRILEPRYTYTYTNSKNAEDRIQHSAKSVSDLTACWPHAGVQTRFSMWTFRTVHLKHCQQWQGSRLQLQTTAEPRSYTNTKCKFSRTRQPHNLMHRCLGIRGLTDENLGICTWFFVLTILHTEVFDLSENIQIARRRHDLV